MKFILITIILLMACDAKPPDSVERLFQDYYQFQLDQFPVSATGKGVEGYDHLLPNMHSASRNSELKAGFKAFLDRIHALETEELTRVERVCLKTMEWECSIALEGYRQPLAVIPNQGNRPAFWLLPVDGKWSLQNGAGQMASGMGVQPFKTVKNYDDWLLRSRDFVQWIDTAIQRMREGVESGVVWNRHLVLRTIGSLEAVITDSVEQHIFYGPIRNMPDLKPEDSLRLANEYRSMIRNEVNPAYRRLIAFLKDTYLPAATELSGFVGLPGGKETYAYMLRYYTTTSMQPEDVFELGERELKRLLAEVSEIKDRMGFEGDLSAFFNWLRNAPEFRPHSSPEEVMADFHTIHERVEQKVGELFSIRPKTPFKIRRTEAYREQAIGPHYMGGNLKTGRPGYFYISIPDAREFNILKNEALFLHEAIPGHHFQIALRQENESLPDFSYFTGVVAFSEGWGLYAESLGEELGLYTDPYQKLGALSMELHRALRLVVDVGLHYKGWTRQQAIDYCLPREAEPLAEIEKSIDRYMGMPGQALAYKVGQLKISSLKQEAKDALGERFDIRAFHDQVLNTGNLPLSVLEYKIRSWIRDQG